MSESYEIASRIFVHKKLNELYDPLFLIQNNEVVNPHDLFYTYESASKDFKWYSRKGIDELLNSNCKIYGGSNEFFQISILPEKLINNVDRRTVLSVIKSSYCLFDINLGEKYFERGVIDYFPQLSFNTLSRINYMVLLALTNIEELIRFENNQFKYIDKNQKSFLEKNNALKYTNNGDLVINDYYLDFFRNNYIHIIPNFPLFILSDKGMGKDLMNELLVGHGLKGIDDANYYSNIEEINEKYMNLLYKIESEGSDCMNLQNTINLFPFELRGTHGGNN